MKIISLTSIEIIWSFFCLFPEMLVRVPSLGKFFFPFFFFFLLCPQHPLEGMVSDVYLVNMCKKKNNYIGIPYCSNSSQFCMSYILVLLPKVEQRNVILNLDLALQYQVS